jgi:hypothetical protein
MSATMSNQQEIQPVPFRISRVTREGLFVQWMVESACFSHWIVVGMVGD